MKWVLAIALLWALLSIDFITDLDLTTHIEFHIIIGLAGTFYIMKNRERVEKTLKGSPINRKSPRN